MDTRNWETAQRKIRDWECGKEPQRIVTTKDATRAFLDDCKARNLSETSISKYQLLFAGLEKFETVRVSVEELRKFRESWKLSPISSLKKLERMKTFFRFCLLSGWLRENPAAAIKPPKVVSTPTLPFSPEEWDKILAACDNYPIKGIYGEGNRDRLRALVLLLRYSGLRIRDAATLRKDRIKNGKLFLYTQKTNTPVWLPLPQIVLDALEKVGDGQFYFWSGNGLPKSTVADWQRSSKKLFELATVSNGHAHRFRDTFSVSLLEAGVPIETVSVLLGHSDIRVTQKHYSPWIKSRQENLERLVMSTWN